MKNLITSLILIIVVYGCQTQFESKTQAKNKINKYGYREGRWVDYLDSNGNKTNDDLNFSTYLLSEYKDGKPVGNFREFYKDNSIKKSGTFKSGVSLYEKNTIPSTPIGLLVYYNNGIMEKKDVYSSDGDILREVYYSINIETKRTDSVSVDYVYYPSKKIKEITFSGNSIVKLEYDEFSWGENIKNGKEYFSGIAKEFKKDGAQRRKAYEENFGKILSNLFNERLEDISAGEKLHFVTIDGSTTDWMSMMKEAYPKWLREVNSPYDNYNGESVENSRAADYGIVIRSEELADNASNYIGKLITVDLVYTAGSRNDNLSLKSGEYRSEEQARSAVIGFYEDNDKYYTRVSDSNAGKLFYLRIPFSLRNSVPNTTSAIILVTGNVKNENTILVRSIRRVN